jgi:hypothetical protein
MMLQDTSTHPTAAGTFARSIAFDVMLARSLTQDWRE